MNKLVKRILLAVIVIACVAGGIYYQSLPLTVAMTQVTPKEAVLDFTEQGVVAAKRVVEIYALASGEIDELYVTEGAKISKGDIICKVDAEQYGFEIKQAEANIKGYEAQIRNLALEESKQKNSLESSKNSLLGELESLEAQEKLSYTTRDEQIRAKAEQVRLQNLIVEQSAKDVERAIENRDKAEMLYNSGAMAQNDYDAAVQTLESAESILAQSKQQLEIIESADIADIAAQYKGQKDSLRAQIAGIEDSMNKSYISAMNEYYTALIESNKISIEQLNKKIDESAITSPVSGTITKLFIKDVNTVSLGVPIASVTTDTANQVEVYVSTKDIDSVEPGKEVELIAERRAADEIFSGIVLYAEDEATIKMSALGVEERRVKVVIEPEKNTKLKPGYDVDVKFIYYQEENKLTVPKTSLFKENDKDMLWLSVDGNLQKTEVVKGVELRTETIIESGISAGDFVINDAALEGLKEGAKVVSE